MIENYDNDLCQFGKIVWVIDKGRTGQRVQGRRSHYRLTETAVECLRVATSFELVLWAYGDPLALAS